MLPAWTQADMNSLEIYIFKNRFTSLRNLTILADIEAVIQEFVSDFIEQIPLADQKTYQLLASGQTLEFSKSKAPFSGSAPQQPTWF